MIFSSTLPDIDIPDMSYPTFALERAAEFGDRPAFIDASTDRALSYSELLRQVAQVAAAFSARGMHKGDVLAICLPNLPEFAVAVYAVTSLGGVVTTVNPLYTPGELVRQLDDAGASYLLTLPPLLDSCRAAVTGIDLREIFVIGEADGATPWATLATDAGTAPEVTIDTARDLALLPYSSGTTGMPKGVMLSHRNLIANVQMLKGGPTQIDDGEVFACVPPMFHIYGIAMYLGAAMALGGTVVCIPRFEFESYVRIIERYRATYAVVVPPVALGLAQHPIVSQHDLSSLRTVVCAAAPLPTPIANAMKERLNVGVRQGFGMTELAGASHTQRDGDPPASVGTALPNVTWKVIDLDSGKALPVGEQGEVCIQAPSVMLGYLNRPDATAETIDADGWLHTGDIGYADDAGRCFLVDRLKELIKYKGYQVAPAELEEILLSHPNVADAGVIPIPDSEAGEVPKAYIVVHGETDAETLMAFVAERVAPYKKLRAVEFVESLPKSPAGKLLRRVLKERSRAT